MINVLDLINSFVEEENIEDFIFERFKNKNSKIKQTKILFCIDDYSFYVPSKVAMRIENIKDPSNTEEEQVNLFKFTPEGNNLRKSLYIPDINKYNNYLEKFMIDFDNYNYLNIEGYKDMKLEQELEIFWKNIKELE